MLRKRKVREVGAYLSGMSLHCHTLADEVHGQSREPGLRGMAEAYRLSALEVYKLVSRG